MKVQIIKCLKCDTLIAACTEESIDAAWLSSVAKYIKTENVIYETVDSPVSFGGKLNDCCGKNIK